MPIRWRISPDFPVLTSGWLWPLSECPDRSLLTEIADVCVEMAVDQSRSLRSGDLNASSEPMLPIEPTRRQSMHFKSSAPNAAPLFNAHLLLRQNYLSVMATPAMVRQCGHSTSIKFPRRLGRKRCGRSVNPRVQRNRSQSGGTETARRWRTCLRILLSNGSTGTGRIHRSVSCRSKI